MVKRLKREKELLLTEIEKHTAILNELKKITGDYENPVAMMNGTSGILKALHYKIMELEEVNNV